jgi:mannose-6-phosphate isomerase-like protein (cupin superfamily)
MDLHKLFQLYDLHDIDKHLGDNYWSPVDVVYVNDHVVRAAAIKGEFHWHSHNDDEMFLVYQGTIIIDTEKGPFTLTQGEGLVIPKGIQHRPRAEQRAVILLIEPAKLKTTGD